MKKLSLKVSKRSELGRNACNRLRKADVIPAVVYGKSGAVNLKVDLKDLRTLFREKGDSAAIVELNDDKDVKLALLQETSRNFITDKVDHIDFHEISQDEEIHATLPVHLKGEAYGVKNEGGVLDFLSHSVEVKCLPKNLPDSIELSVSDLKAGQAIKIENLAAIKGVSYAQAKNTVIVTCVAAGGGSESEEKEAAEE